MNEIDNALAQLAVADGRVVARRPRGTASQEPDRSCAHAEDREEPSKHGLGRNEPPIPGSHSVAHFLRTDYRRVVATVAWICGDQVDAADAVSEALVRLLEQEAKGGHIENATAWVTRTAMNLGRSERRHLAVRLRRLPLLQEAAASDDIERQAEALDLRAAIATLPRRQAQVTGLRFGLGLSFEEIARVLGISEGGARASLAKAKKSLAEKLGLHEEGDA